MQVLLNWALPLELPYAVLFAVAAFVLPVALFTTVSLQKRLWVGAINAIINFIAGVIAGTLFWLNNPHFATQWSAGNIVPLICGTAFLALTTGMCAGFTTARTSGDRYRYNDAVALSSLGGFGAVLIPALLCFCLVVWEGGSLTWFVEPNHSVFNGRAPWCDPTGVEHMLQLFQPTQGKAGQLQDADPNHLIRVTPNAALGKAKQVLPGDIGSYLQPGTAYLQKLDGNWVYIVDLKPSDFGSFTNAGNYAPGYIVVSAEDPNAKAVYRGGFKIKYVPDLGSFFTNDLDEYVYFNFTVPKARGLVVDDLHGMEVRDGDGRPFYTGTLEEPVVGNTGYKIVGMIVVDPQTGEISWDKSISEIPGWVDRIYPEDYIKDLASNWWALYANHYVCTPRSQLGELHVDSTSYQLTGHGDAQYVFTYTSPNASDTSMVGELVVNPTTGAAINIPLSGATESAAESTIQKQLDTVSQKAQFDPQLCQLQQFYSQYVWYCVIDQGDTYKGVALLDTRYTTDPSKVLYAPDLTTLVGLYQQQLGGTLPSGSISNTSGTLTLTGTVSHLSSVLVNQGGTEYRVFQLHGKDIPDAAVFWIAMPNNAAALMQVGDNVTIVVNAPGGKLPTDQHVVVSSLVDKNLPDGTPQMYRVTPGQ